MKRLLALTVLICCLLCAAAHADIYIQEAVSKNLTLHPDQQGKVHDYVILSNNGQAAVSLAGMTLCDEAGKAYPLPDRQLAPDEQLLIYCTGKKGGAPFKLSADGETLYLKNADGSTHSSLTIPAMDANERFVDMQGQIALGKVFPAVRVLKERQRVGLGRLIVVFGGCSAEIGTGHIVLVTETVGKELLVIGTEALGSLQELQHLQRSLFVDGIQGQSRNGQSRGVLWFLERSLRHRFHLFQTHRQLGERHSVGLVASACNGIADRLFQILGGLSLQFIKQ